MPFLNTDVNGMRTSYCSIELGVDGLRLTGVKSINFRDPAEIGKIRGFQTGPKGRTRGQHMPEGDMEIYQADWAKVLLPKLSFFKLKGWAETSWPVKLVYAEAASPFDTVRVELLGVRFHSDEHSAAEGSTDALVVKVAMDIMRIRVDGYEQFKER